MEALFSDTVFEFWILPFAIFAARVTDVSLGTLRTAFIGQGVKIWAAALGFVEVLIWLIAIVYILQHLRSPFHYLAYASGFAVGNYVGLTIEEKMARGLASVMIITHQDATGLVESLKSAQFGITSLTATGVTGRVRLILSIVKRKDLEGLRSLVEKVHPRAFMVVQPVKSVSRDLFPISSQQESRTDPLFWRKGK